MSETKIFHFSVDDTIECFKDINTNNYNTIFQNPTFAWFKDLHEKFGVVISCYVYYQDGEFALSDCTDRYRNEFASNEEWLRFGFHTLDKKTVYDKTDIYADYVKTMKELIRIVGSGSIDHVIRLQGFQGNSENIEDLVDSEIEPIVGLLTSDDGKEQYARKTEKIGRAHV